MLPLHSPLGLVSRLSCRIFSSVPLVLVLLRLHPRWRRPARTVSLLQHSYPGSPRMVSRVFMLRRPCNQRPRQLQRVLQLRRRLTELCGVPRCSD